VISPASAHGAISCRFGKASGGAIRPCTAAISRVSFPLLLSFLYLSLSFDLSFGGGKGNDCGAMNECDERREPAEAPTLMM
jgi:hypothetical protein